MFELNIIVPIGDDEHVIEEVDPEYDTVTAGLGDFEGRVTVVDKALFDSFLAIGNEPEDASPGTSTDAEPWEWSAAPTEIIAVLVLSPENKLLLSFPVAKEIEAVGTSVGIISSLLQVVIEVRNEEESLPDTNGSTSEHSFFRSEDKCVELREWFCSINPSVNSGSWKYRSQE